jgi:integrase
VTTGRPGLLPMWWTRLRSLKSETKYIAAFRSAAGSRSARPVVPKSSLAWSSTKSLWSIVRQTRKPSSTVGRRQPGPVCRAAQRTRASRRQSPLLSRESHSIRRSRSGLAGCLITITALKAMRSNVWKHGRSRRQTLDCRRQRQRSSKLDMRDKLTVGQIKAAIRRPDHQFINDGAGLYLSIREGKASWVYRVIIANKEHRRGLGPYPEITLPRARQKLLEYRRSVLDGTFLKPKGVDFETAARECHSTLAERWRSAKHRVQWLSSVERLTFPVLAKKRVDEIDVHDIKRVLLPLWRNKCATGQRVRGRIEAILDWAAANGHRHNPARWDGHLEHLLPGGTAAKHFEALPYADVPSFVANLRARDSLAARALEFTILTAARTGETVSATWPEINSEGALWVIRAERMKMGREHRVPLCTRALSILDDVRWVAKDRCFPIGKNGMHELAGSIVPGITVHGFRSSFTDWVTEQTDFPREVREMALAHAVGNKVEEAYRRGGLLEKRRQLMDAWASFVDG